MSFAKFLVRTVVIAVAMFALGFLGHQLWFGRDYSATESIMRSKVEHAGR